MRVTVYIDGFNLYHAIEENKHLHRYKWLNYVELAKCYLQGREHLAGIKVFTALATWDAGKVKRHNDFLAVQKSLGAEIVMGRFKHITRKCRLCQRDYDTFEEKQTDVNIAIHLFRDAYLDLYDKAILVTADTDLIPAIQAVQDTFLGKQVGVVCPLGRSSKELKQVCDFHFQMKERQLARCLLPDAFDCGRAGIKKRPDAWI